MVGVSGVFALGGGGQAVSVRSAQPVAEREGLGVGELTGEQAERFAAARRAAGLVTWVSPRSVTLPLEYLRELGVVPAPVPAGPRRARWRSCWRITAGICWSSAGCRSTRCSMRMSRPRGCSWRAGRARMGWAWSGCAAADVSLFLARECPKRSVSGARDLVCALRSLSALPARGGADRAPLVWAVPSVADLRDRVAAARSGAGRGRAGCWPAAIGAGWSAGAITRSCCCCRGWGCAPARSPRSAGRRRLAAGLLLVHGKGSRQDVLPLPVDVGEAMVSYLRRRPRCECRALFLRVTAPRGG